MPEVAHREYPRTVMETTLPDLAADNIDEVLAHPGINRDL